MTKQRCTRNWTIHPGELLLDIMEEDGITKQDLSAKTGMALEELNDILEGGEIDQRLASLLENGTGMSADFWLRAESNYSNDLDRLAPKSAGDMQDLNDFVRLRGSASTTFKEFYLQLIAKEEHFEYAQILKNADDYILFAELRDQAVHLHLTANSSRGTYVAFGPKLAKLTMAMAMIMGMGDNAPSFLGRPVVLA